MQRALYELEPMVSQPIAVSSRIWISDSHVTAGDYDTVFDGTIPSKL